MHPTPKIIKSSKFEDGTFTIKAPVHPLPLIEAEAGAEGLDPLREQAEAESRALLQRARDAADETLAAGEARLAALEQQLRTSLEAERAQVLERARQEGFAKGEAEGRQTGEQTVVDLHADALASLCRAIETSDLDRKRWAEAQNKDLVKLAVLIAQKVMILELAHSRDAVLRMAEAALQHVTDKSQVRLRAHPLDVPRLNAARGQLLLATDNLSQLEIVADPAVGLGGCMIDTRTGMIDARLSTQLAEIAASLLDIAPGPDGAADLDPVVLAAVRALGQGGHVLSQAPAPVAAAPRPRTAPAPEVLAAPAVQAGQAAALAAAFQAPLEEQAPEPVVELAPAAPASWLMDEATQVVEAELAPDEAALPAPLAPPVMEARIEPIVDAPVVHAQAPEAEPTPTAPTPAPLTTAEETRQKALDPSRRAADALAARLGRLKKGRGVSTLAEEFDMTQLEGALTDVELEAIVRNTSRAQLQSDIDTSEILVHNPYAVEEAADALAERLGKKKKRTSYRDAVPESDLPPQAGALDMALGDSRIDEIMGTILPRASGDEETPAEAARAPDIDKASENLARLLGQPKKKNNRPWYEQ